MWDDVCPAWSECVHEPSVIWLSCVLWRYLTHSCCSVFSRLSIVCFSGEVINSCRKNNDPSMKKMGGDPLKNLVDLCEKGEGLSWGWAINKCKACFRCILRRWFWSPVCLCAAVHCPETAQAGIAVNSLVICARFLGACFFLSLMFFSSSEFVIVQNKTHTHTKHTKPQNKTAATFACSCVQKRRSSLFIPTSFIKRWMTELLICTAVNSCRLYQRIQCAIAEMGLQRANHHILSIKFAIKPAKKG